MGSVTTELGRDVSSPEPTKAGVQVSRSNHYLRFGELGNPTFTSAIAAGADLIAHNIPVAVLAGVAAEVVKRHTRLSDDEAAVLDVLRRLTQGGSIYKVWIAQDELLAAMDPELDLEGRRRLLANMKKRGILEEGAGIWRAVL
jgi:hypothetical protein